MTTRQHSAAPGRRKFRVGQLLKYGSDYLLVRKVHHGHLHCVRYLASLTAQLFNVETDDKYLRRITKREAGR